MCSLPAVVVNEEALLVRKAADTSITFVVFLFGVLLSTAVIQLYVVSGGIRPHDQTGTYNDVDLSPST